MIEKISNIVALILIRFSKWNQTKAFLAGEKRAKKYGYESWLTEWSIMQEHFWYKIGKFVNSN